MEPVTHLLTGAVLSRAGFNRKTALATVTMTLAAEAADIDILAHVNGSAAYFIEHRGITHTFIGLPFVAAATLGVVWLGDQAWQWWRARGGKPKSEDRRWGWLYLLACIACLSHLLLDFTNNYGVRPFYPFIRRWFAWDIVFIVEPVMLALLLGALLLPWLFGLVGQEIGARQKGPRGRGAAILALLAIAALWGLRDFEHRRALAALEAVEFEGSLSVRVAAFPYMINPFKWAGVAESEKAYVSVVVDSLRPEVDPGNRAVTYYKPEPTPAVLLARQSPLGRAYLEWSRFPLLESEHLAGPQQGELVHLTDVRFSYPDEHRRALEAYVLLDGRGKVASEGFELPAQRGESGR